MIVFGKILALSIFLFMSDGLATKQDVPSCSLVFKKDKLLGSSKDFRKDDLYTSGSSASDFGWSLIPGALPPPVTLLNQAAVRNRLKTPDAVINDHLKALNTQIFTKDNNRLFWSETWGFIREMARSQGLTVVEMLVDQSVLMGLLTAAVIGESEEIQKELADYSFAINRLEEIPLTAKLTREDWKHVETTYQFFAYLGFHLRLLQNEKQVVHRFEPFLPVDTNYITKLFEGIEEITFDGALEGMINFQERGAFQDSPIISKFKSRYMQPFNTHGVSSSNPQMDGMVGNFETPDSLKPDMDDIVADDDIDIEPVSSDTYIWRHPRKTNQVPEIDLTLDPPVIPLKMALETPSMLQADRDYEVKTIWGNHLLVKLSSDVAENDIPEERRLILRLLRTMYRGRGDSSGIKTLFDSGPAFIEVKGVIHTHKRLIGCLIGNRVYLTEFRVMPIKRSGYSRFRNYCRALLSEQ